MRIETNPVEKMKNKAKPTWEKRRIRGRIDNIQANEQCGFFQWEWENVGNWVYVTTKNNAKEEWQSAEGKVRKKRGGVKMKNKKKKKI